MTHPKNSTLVSRNVTLDNDHRTSMRLEPVMWEGLEEIGKRENMSVSELCSMVDRKKPGPTSLTAAVRVFIMQYYRKAATEQGHTSARHGSLRLYGEDIMHPDIFLASRDGFRTPRYLANKG